MMDTSRSSTEMYYARSKAKIAFLIIAAAALLLFPVVVWLVTISYFPSLELFIYQFSRLFSLSAFILLFFQFLVGARIKAIERRVGIDRMFHLHRNLGISAYVLIVLHFVFYELYELGFLGALSLSLLKFLGVFSLIALTVTAGVALLYKRLSMRYETWRNIHRFNYVLLPVIFIHSTLLGTTLNSQTVLRVYWFSIISAFGLILLYKLVKRLNRNKRRYEVSGVRQITHDTWELSLLGPKIKHDPGQFTFIKPIHNGKPLSWHHFTISSSPDEEQARLSIKEVGDFTSKIKEFNKNDYAYLDAPYGVFTLPENDKKDLVFIAGGIGITPILSMLRFLRARKDTRQILLIWGNKREEDIAFREEIESLPKNLINFNLVHILSHDENWEGEKGYVDERILDTYIGDYINKEIYLCGPPIMMEKVLSLLDEKKEEGTAIYTERFAL